MAVVVCSDLFVSVVLLLVFILDGATRPATTVAAVITWVGGWAWAVTGAVVAVCTGAGGVGVACFDLTSFSCFLLRTWRAKVD